MKETEKRTCDTSIYIVCEGTKSEPWFLLKFIEHASERFDLNYTYEIFPTPKRAKKEDVENQEKKTPKPKLNKRKSSGRKLQDPIHDVDPTPEETPRGGNPLYWVNHGKEKLKSYSEVFVVFDKDGHPKMEDAFEAANKAVEKDRKVTIILSSRSFEYYMLMHFEQLYRAFDKTECGEKVYGKGGKSHTNYYNCCLSDAIPGKACQGNLCINGYARRQGYWTDSKDEKTFLTATNIWRGMQNAEFIRSMALSKNPGVYPDVYKLNPYLDFQLLLARLLELKILRDEKPIHKDCGRKELQVITRSGNNLILTNGSSALKMKLEDGWLEYFEYPSISEIFEEFKKRYASIEDAEKNYANHQFEHHSISKESGVELDKQQAISLPLLSALNNCNTFAILSFNSNRYLIL